MSTTSTAQDKARPVIVWESRPERQAGSVIAWPSRSGWPGVVDQEASVKTWTVGPAENPAVITGVSSGFHRKSAPAAAPQATRMSLAA